MRGGSFTSPVLAQPALQVAGDTQHMPGEHNTCLVRLLSCPLRSPLCCSLFQLHPLSPRTFGIQVCRHQLPAHDAEAGIGAPSSQFHLADLLGSISQHWDSLRGGDSGNRAAEGVASGGDNAAPSSSRDSSAGNLGAAPAVLEEENRERGSDSVLAGALAGGVLGALVGGAWMLLGVANGWRSRRNGR